MHVLESVILTKIIIDTIKEFLLCAKDNVILDSYTLGFMFSTWHLMGQSVAFCTFL